MNEPSFWHERDLQSRRSAPLTRLLLTPVAKLYSYAGKRRIDRTEPFAPGVPVICVGNLTMGGSGKTPIVAAIRSHLASEGLRAASLSRGYKGELEGPLRVEPAEHTAKQVGDEPLMLAQSGEAWIGADRVAAAKAMVADGVQVIIMDDGHQNPTLKKDLSILVIDGGNPVGNGFVFPKGPLREPASRGIERADAVIVMGDLAHPMPELDPVDMPIISGKLAPRGPAPAGPLVAFAGIGRPQKFFDTLTSVGAELADAVPFPDHHTFTENDLLYLKQLAADRDAQLITTEKDFVRLPRQDRSGILTFPVDAVFDAHTLTALLGPLIRTQE